MDKTRNSCSTFAPDFACQILLNSRVIQETQEAQLMVTNPRDAFRGDRGRGPKHGTIRYVRYGFLLVCYSNFVSKMCRYPDKCKKTVVYLQVITAK